MFTSTTIMQVVALFLAFAVTALAKPLELTQRDAIAPPITNPTADTVWRVGEKQTVTWDLSSLNGAQPSNPHASIILGTFIDGQEHLMVDSPIITGFLILDGNVTLTVPSVPTGSNYIVCLFGTSGDISPAFTIIGTDTSSLTTNVNVASKSHKLPPHQTTDPATTVSLPPTGVTRTDPGTTSASTLTTTSGSGNSTSLTTTASITSGVLPSGVSATSPSVTSPATSASGTSTFPTSSGTGTPGNSGARVLVTNAHIWGAVAGALAFWAFL